MRKEFETIAQYKEQMRAMLDKAEAEKRALDANEKEQFEQLKTKKELLEMKVERRALEDINAGLVSDRRVLFSQAVFDVVNHRSLEEYNGVVSEGGIKVVERAVTVTDATDAASMVPVTIGEIIEPLEKGLVIDKLGIKMQSGLVGDLVFPTLAAVEATIQGENVAVTDTELNIDKIKASPKRVSISIPVSKRAINQTNYSLQDVVLKQISLGVARALNKWMFSSTALSGASNGVFVKTKPSVEYTNALTFADIVSLESTVMDAGVDVTDGTAAYVCTPKVYGALKSTPKAAGAAEMICQNGMVNGYPVLVTNYMDADSIGFGVFSNAAIGQFGDMDLVIDPYTGAKSNIVNFVLNTDYDIVVARPEAFAIAKKKASA